MVSRLNCLGLLIPLCLVFGCGDSGPRLVPASGRVLQAGQPVTAGSIIFYPATENAFQDDNPSSLLELDGSFTMKTFPFGEGVTPGRFKVTLAPELAERLNKPEYADPTATPWEVEVPDQGFDDLILEVK